MLRKSEAKELLCPRCSQPTLIKAGFTTSKYGKWQRFKCLNIHCDLKATTTPKLGEVVKEVPIRQGDEVIVIRRDAKGHFIPREKGGGNASR